ncbi:NTP transferase domain-containing protein [Candidatus Pelagibacter sp.]|nr:NTP transferase domain-containing protein [Candidatus Pelagibacter sp.]|tara:strand:+ start:362 stop:1090 length:729 start_codon:yes stop_codon:yes gene_type:complete
MQLIVLSAGKGSRLPARFRTKPKCLVELSNKPLLLYNNDFFKKFKKKIIVTGYKKNLLKIISMKNGFNAIYNKDYSKTNMVYSLFLAKKSVTEDVVIVYGDIIFDQNIYELLNEKKNLLPVNINWLKNWKKRMTMNNILKDAENLIIRNGKLFEIGTKLYKNKLPKHQFMGIIKLKKDAFIKCKNFFKKLKNDKIDMTSFLNLCVKKNIISIKTITYKSFWYEIDTIADYKFAQKDVKKIKF